MRFTFFPVIRLTRAQTLNSERRDAHHEKVMRNAGPSGRGDSRRKPIGIRLKGRLMRIGTTKTVKRQVTDAVPNALLHTLACLLFFDLGHSQNCLKP